MVSPVVLAAMAVPPVLAALVAPKAPALSVALVVTVAMAAPVRWR